MPRILAIETSCDETAAAVVEGDGTEPVRVLSSTMASQVALHAKYGGVFPDLAAREHTKRILPVIGLSLHEAGLLKDLPATRRVARRAGPTSAGEPVQRALESIDAIAVTVGPGLIGPLLIGTTAAKQLALLANKPLIPINHWEGHLYSVFLVDGQVNSERLAESSSHDGLPLTAHRLPKFPILFLTVSGGHTSLILMRDHFNYEILGSTLDDAAGEAFDKCARMLGLGYPGGAALSREATKARSTGRAGISPPWRGEGGALKLPRPMIDSGNLDFSFSGLKTAVRYAIDRGEIDLDVRSTNHEVRDESQSRAPNVVRRASVPEAAREIEDAIVDVLLGKLQQAIEQTQPASVAIVGGVSANTELRRRFQELLTSNVFRLASYLPSGPYTTDNAAMIGAAGLFRLIKGVGIAPDPLAIDANASLRLGPSTVSFPQP